MHPSVTLSGSFTLQWEFTESAWSSSNHIRSG